MKTTDHPPHYSGQTEDATFLKELIREVSSSKNIDSHKRLIKEIAAQLKISFFDCAAAFAYLYKPELVEINNEQAPERDRPGSRASSQPAKIRFVRYRLAVGHVHQVMVEELKKVLVEESGVDIKNISHARIYDTFTLIDLPDEMPQEIFNHLKTVEINHQKLDIRRVKNRNKMRNYRKNRSSRKTGPMQGSARDSSG